MDVVGVHDFDTARWLLGRDPTAVFAQVHAPVYRDTDVDNAYITIALGDAAATVHLSRTSTYGMDIRCEVVGAGRVDPDRRAAPSAAGTVVLTGRLVRAPSRPTAAAASPRCLPGPDGRASGGRAAARRRPARRSTTTAGRWRRRWLRAPAPPGASDSTWARPGTGTRRPPYRPRRASIFYLLPTSSVSFRRRSWLGS